MIALALITAILLSLDYSFTQALLISLVFCPCAIVLEWLMPKAEQPVHKLYVFALVLVASVLLILLIHGPSRHDRPSF